MPPGTAHPAQVASSMNSQFGACSRRARRQRAAARRPGCIDQLASSCMRPLRWARPTAVSARGLDIGEAFGRCRIAHRGVQRAQREVGRCGRNRARNPRGRRTPTAERPDSRDGAEQRALAGAGRPTHQHARPSGISTSALDRKVRPVGNPRSTWSSASVVPSPASNATPGFSRCCSCVVTIAVWKPVRRSTVAFQLAKVV